MLVPPVLDKYALRAKVGEGPFGTVYQAWDQVLEVECRLKVLHPELAQDSALVDRWRRLLARVTQVEHPALVVPLDVNEDQGFYFVVLPALPQDLRQQLVLHGPWGPTRALALVRTLAEAVQAAHAQGLVHGDIKPSNVLLDAAGAHPALSDLGWMQAAVETYGPRVVERVPRLAGSPYVPPEVTRTGGWGPAADVYGLAQLLHELLTGRTAVVEGEQVRLASPDMLGDLASALQAGLQPDPARRPADVAAWLALLPGGEMPSERPEGFASEVGPFPDAEPQFEPLPTPAEAQAAADASAFAVPDPLLTTEADTATSGKTLWLGCGIVGLLVLLFACVVAAGGAAAWVWWSQRPADIEPAVSVAAPDDEDEPFSFDDFDIPTPDAALVAQAEHVWNTTAVATPDLEDSFDDPATGLPDDDSDDTGVLDYDDGHYRIVALPSGYIMAGFYPQSYGGVALEVQVHLPPSNEPGGDGSFGFVCAAQDEDAYYTFDLSEDGYAAIWKSLPDDIVALAPWTEVPPDLMDALHQGEWVTLRAVCSPEVMALWANGQVLVAAQDADPYAEGQVGLFVNTLEKDHLEVWFDGFRLWELQP